MANKKDMPSLDELKKDAVNMTTENDSEDKEGLILDDDDDVIEEAPPATEENTNEESQAYDGPGAVVDKLPGENSNGREGIPIGPMANKDTRNAVESTLRDLDEQIIAEHKRFLELTDGGKRTTPPPKQDASGKPVTEDVTILIDKLGLGELAFTEDEKKRIEKAKKIKLVEVTNKELQTVKIAKKFDREKQKTFIQRSFNRALSPVLALSSGYTGKMKNVSAVEAIQMMQRPGQDSASTLIEKWSLIYSKLTDLSCGPFESFDDFIAHTAYNDYNNFIFSILCSSYPEEDSISFTCDRENCGKRFEIKYKNKDLIRNDLITPDQATAISSLISAASNADIETGKELLKLSPVGAVDRFLLDEESGFIVDAYVPSVKEQCEKILPAITRDMAQESKRPVVLLAHNISAILMPADSEVDGVEEGEYILVDEFEDIVEVLSQMNEGQLATISNRINKLMEPYTINYGIKEVICPHCKHNYGQLTTPLEDLLFQRVQARMTTEIE